MTFRYKSIYPEDEPPGPQPLWEPVVHRRYPFYFEPGDIYINVYKDPNLVYFFPSKGECDMISREEVEEWVTGGLMRRPPATPQNEHPLPGPTYEEYS